MVVEFGVRPSGLRRDDGVFCVRMECVDINGGGGAFAGVVGFRVLVPLPYPLSSFPRSISSFRDHLLPSFVSILLLGS